VLPSSPFFFIGENSLKSEIKNEKSENLSVFEGLELPEVRIKLNLKFPDFYSWCLVL
jgi:hypothetical protein